jgi:allantoinase
MSDPRDSLPVTGPITGEEEPAIIPVPFPDGARIAVNIKFVLEAWSGTNTGHSLGSGLSAKARGMGVPDWATVSWQEYGGRTGVWRILKTLERYGVAGSCSTSALAAERWPDAVKAITGAGHEIVAHGYAQDQPMVEMDEAEDYAVVSKTADIFESLTGVRPVGWGSHGARRGNHTVQNMLKTGYFYTNDFRDADQAYVVAEQGDRKMVALPRTDEVNDMFLFRNNGHPPQVYVDYFKQAFDQLYAEGTAGGFHGVVSCVAHSTLIGRPWGVSALAECIEYAQGFPDVWIATQRQVAENFLSGLAGA